MQHQHAVIITNFNQTINDLNQTVDDLSVRLAAALLQTPPKPFRPRVPKSSVDYNLILIQPLLLTPKFKRIWIKRYIPVISYRPDSSPRPATTRRPSRHYWRLKIWAGR